MNLKGRVHQMIIFKLQLPTVFILGILFLKGFLLHFVHKKVVQNENHFRSLLMDVGRIHQKIKFSHPVEYLVSADPDRILM